MRLHLSTGKCPRSRASKQIAHVLAKLEFFLFSSFSFSLSLPLSLRLCFSVQVYSATWVFLVGSFFFSFFSFSLP